MNFEKNLRTRRIYKKLRVLEDKINGIPFPAMKRARQVSIYACGPATLEMLLSFLGQKASQKGMIKSLRAGEKIKKYGLNVKDLAKAAKFLSKGKFVFWRKHNATINDLYKITSKFKFPVGVEWQGVFYEFSDEDSGHYGVITRVIKKSGSLRIADPFSEFSGVDRRFSLKFFEKRWWDENVIKGRTIRDKKVMFVVTPKGDTWPKKLGMVRV